MANTRQRSVQRYARYQRVLEKIIEFDCLSLDELKRQCADERPAFVTRVLRQLEQAGWVLREDQAADETYRWNPRRTSFSVAGWLDEKIFGASLPNTPLQERPRERLLNHGAVSLRTAELLAILIRSGRPGESALQAGEKIAARLADRIDKLPTCGPQELKSISSAISPAAYCQIMAGIELGRRVAAAADNASTPTRITGSETALQFCQQQFARLSADAAQEEFHVVCLDTKHQVLRCHQITVGTLNASLVHPREVFRPAIQDAAAAIILVHNHPSGDPTPSEEDLQVTKNLEQAGQTVGIQVLDHVILGNNCAISIREQRH